MSAVKDFFQNAGSVLTLGIIPPAMPHVEEFSEEDFQKLVKEAELNLGLDTSLQDFPASDVESIEKLMTDIPSYYTPPPPVTYGPMYPYK